MRTAKIMTAGIAAVAMLSSTAAFAGTVTRAPAALPDAGKVGTVDVRKVSKIKRKANGAGGAGFTMNGVKYVFIAFAAGAAGYGIYEAADGSGDRITSGIN